MDLWPEPCDHGDEGRIGPLFERRVTVELIKSSGELKGKFTEKQYRCRDVITAMLGYSIWHQTLVTLPLRGTRTYSYSIGNLNLPHPGISARTSRLALF